MVRVIGLTLAFGLLALGVIGAFGAASPLWFVVLDFVAGGVALVAIVALWLGHGRGSGLVAVALALALAALWIVGLATGAAAWLSWCLFAWACAFLLIGLVRLAAPRYGYRPLPDL